MLSRPVIFLSFAGIKEISFAQARKKICQIIKNLYNQSDFLLNGSYLNADEKTEYRKISATMDDYMASDALKQLSEYLYRFYGKKAIILLDEYDTPLQEAYVGGYWKELVAFTRNLFNATFKTNPWLERGIMTGITRVSKESIFSDLNNLEVVTTTSDKYTTAFGFTEEEVFTSLEECGLSEIKEQVKWWYDGFVFGRHKDIYNPWSILNFLDTAKLSAYWANTSSNSLVGKLLQQGSRKIKEQFELLENGEKVMYDLALTNYEVKRMFQNMVRGWFERSESDYNDFIKALLLDDLDAMNEYMRRVALNIFSYFDTG